MKVKVVTYLVVTVWALISETFDMIGIPIMDAKDVLDAIENDDRVWKLFEDGITCTLNQVDSDWGTQLAMKYKISSFREASMMAAAIRPSFDSWRERFLSREPNKTGCKQLDEVFSSTDGYLLFQENLMQYFEFLDVTPAESIGLIKKISKKKIKPEDFVNLEERIKVAWIRKVGTIDGFQENWDMIQACMAYGFCSAHAAATGLDMCYGAYLKVNYPYEYYTVCFNNYSSDEVRTNKLTKELAYFNIGLSNVKFRYSKSTYSFDKEKRKIYKGMASIKYLNATMSDELYELRNKNYNDFIDLLIDIKRNTSTNTRQLDILIKLDFFSEFGEINQLLKYNDLFQLLYGKKQIRKDKLKDLGLRPEDVGPYAEKETVKMYSKINTYALLKNLITVIAVPRTTMLDKIHWQQECLGYIDIIDKSYKGLAVVTELDVKFSPKLKLYALANGNTIDVKIDKKTFHCNKIKEGDVIRIEKQIYKPRCKRNEETGEFESIPDKKVLWLTKYKKVVI